MREDNFYYLEGRKNIEKWKSIFTEPAHHDPSHFTYLIHSYYIHANSGNKLEILGNAQAYFKSPEHLFSTSLINQDKPYSFSWFGHILEINPKSIIATHHEDMVSSLHVFDDTPIGDKINLINQSFPIKSPSEIMSIHRDYNEIVIIGDESTSIKGGYLIIPDGMTREKVIKKIHADTPEYMEAWQSFLNSLEKNNYPLIEIKSPIEPRYK